MNIADLARHCSVSTATILRTAQKLNFSGYSEFKYFLRSDSAENAEVLNLIEILNQDIAQTTKLFLQNSQVLGYLPADRTVQPDLCLWNRTGPAPDAPGTGPLFLECK